ncbi:hypothetical protein RDI58_018755 [Solanum bulbocastanum]|uniref:Uncharacterized protein n=1 Tax=Solanum bulbocastanum TaxID=147425 RepID=A0AAN8TCK4_SOLBU
MTRLETPYILAFDLLSGRNSGCASIEDGGIRGCRYEEVYEQEARDFLKYPTPHALESVPLYLFEMAPHKYRRALNIDFQLSITICILVASVSNYFFAKIHGVWRLS